MPFPSPPDRPTRRRVIGGSMTASLTWQGGMTMAAAQADSELIALCHRLVAIETALASRLAERKTLADEQRTQPAVDRLYAAQAVTFARLEVLPGAVTPAGIGALGRAAMAMAPCNLDGSLIHAGDAEWLAFRALHALLALP